MARQARAYPLILAVALFGCARSHGSAPDGGSDGTVDGGSGVVDGGSAVGDAAAGDAAAAPDGNGPGDMAHGDPTYSPVVINFDDLPLGTDVTNQYGKYATFASDPGCACRVSDDAGAAASPPNYIFTYYTCANGDRASVFVDFARPVRNLRFNGVGVNSSGKVATLRLITASGTQTADLVGGSGSSLTAKVDVSFARDVERLEIGDVDDAFGMGFDDFSFDFPDR